MKRFTILIPVFFISIISFSQKSDIQVLKDNLLRDALVNQGYKPRIERYITSDYLKAGEYLKKQNKKGGWNDVDYADHDNNWHPLHHLDRLLVMSWNYMKEDVNLYQNKKLLAGIEKAIAYWYEINPKCDNWYKNRIAKQFYFNVIALLLDGEIDSNLHKKMINDLTEVPTMTGSNRTLLAISTFYKGVLENDPIKIKLGVSGVTDQIIITTKEGVQPDFSFHQHGKFIYNGSYGFNYLRESAWLATIVRETQFAFSPDHIKVLRNYYLNGTRWMVRGETIDYNVRGRQVGRQDALKGYADLLIPVLKNLALADPEYSKDYEESIHRIRHQLPQDILGHKHFWRSDYTIHHMKNYSTSLKMCSERTVGIELNMNSENKLGYWLPYGLTYIYKRGDEYNNIFPVWDWARLPGVTNPYIEIEEKGKGVAHTQQTSFVGGMSNGKFGISAMDFEKNKTKAKKAWFWFGNEWIALGTGIESEHEAPIITTINQCILNGNVNVNGNIFTGKQKSVKGAKWITHDEVTYFFPKETDIELKADVQQGNMKRIYGLGKDSVYSDKVFSLWINHGEKPIDGNYEYVVIPDAENKNLEMYSINPPVWILINTREVQAVYQKNLRLTGIVFYEKGELETGNLVISVDHPCLLLIDEKNSSFSISDPTAKLENISISIKKNGKAIFNGPLKLPQNGFSGKSITKDLMI